MPQHIVTLIIILTIAISIFALAKKHIEHIVQPEEFIRWRNAWVIITLIAFLAGNFWIYIFATGLYLHYATKKIENRLAFYFVILFAVPPIAMRLGPLINVNYYVLLGIVILLPMFFSDEHRKDAPKFGRLGTDWLIIVLITLMTLLEMRDTTFTDAMRNGIDRALVVFLPYFVASRVKDFNQLKVAIIAFTLAGLIAGSFGIFEHFKQWLLYHPLPNAMHADFSLATYLARGDGLRASSSLGHALILGLLMVVVFGFYLFVAPLINNKWARWLCQIAVLGGLYAPLSRGPWLSAAILFFIYIAMSPKVMTKLPITLFFSAIIAVALPVIPGGEKIINKLPFVGNVDQFNVAYRDVLLDKGLQIIAREPLFGVARPELQPEMADMVQGQGLVDIVNYYLNIALGYGIPALILFVSFFVLAIYRTYQSRKKVKDKNSAEYRCGTVLVATMLAILVDIASTSGIAAIPTILYSLAGFMYGYSRVINSTYKKKFSWQ